MTPEDPTPHHHESAPYDADRYRSARRRVHELRGFYSHALVYVIVNALLAGYNLIIEPGSTWFVFPLIGWGIGLLGHGLFVFSRGRFLGRDWEERKIRQILDREREETRRGRR